MRDALIERLQSKSPEEAIIERIGHDFNLAPFIARMQFEQMQSYFESYLGLKREVGQLTYFAVSARVPPGRKIAESERTPVALTLHNPDDLEALHEGVAALRRSKIQRITVEAEEQGGLLTQEDLSCLLCSSLSTIKRDIVTLRQQDVHIPTRGQVKDIGRGVSHKGWIVKDWLVGYTFTQIKQRRRHSIAAIERYCRDFQRVVRLHHGGFKIGDIRGGTGLSESLIKEYLILYEEAGATNERIQQMLQTPSPATETPAVIKRGALLQ